jgi:hypothetical protein
MNSDEMNHFISVLLRKLRNLCLSPVRGQFQHLLVLGAILTAIAVTMLPASAASSSNKGENSHNRDKLAAPSATRVEQVAKSKNLLNSQAGKTQDLGALKNAMNESDLKKLGILRHAQTEKGMYGLGTATRAEADDIGKAWVGPNATPSESGKALISQDGLRQYRSPQEKRSSRESVTGTQANIESRSTPSGRWTNNGHLDIID